MKKKVITALTLATALSSLFGGTAFASTAHYNDATQAAFAISYKSLVYPGWVTLCLEHRSPPGSLLQLVSLSLLHRV